jgi:L-ascorbate metabolism protein UlaG (beta-lactamase superfamily)
MLAAGSRGLGGPKPGAPAHHLEHGFRNLNAGRPRSWVSARFLARRFWSLAFQPRSAHLPRVANDGRALRENRGEATVTWVGHATLLVQLHGLNLLTDPQWSDRASPLSWAGPRRLTAPGLRLEDLPPIHAVVISHDHYDHLDVPTLRRLAATHHPLFLAPLGFKAWFAGLGIAEAEERDWWESRTLGPLTLTLVPAQHWGARSLWDENRRLWGGWVVAGASKRLYFAGDTGYWEGLGEIGRRLGPFDLAAIPIGAYQPTEMMRLSHTTPEQALRLFGEVGGRRFMGIHWGTFDLTEEPIEEPARRAEAEAHRLGLGSERVWIPKAGETRPW